MFATNWPEPTASPNGAVRSAVRNSAIVVGASGPNSLNQIGLATPNPSPKIRSRPGYHKPDGPSTRPGG